MKKFIAVFLLITSIVCFSMGLSACTKTPEETELPEEYKAIKGKEFNLSDYFEVEEVIENTEYIFHHKFNDDIVKNAIKIYLSAIKNIKISYVAEFKKADHYFMYNNAAEYLESMFEGEYPIYKHISFLDNDYNLKDESSNYISSKYKSKQITITKVSDKDIILDIEFKNFIVVFANDTNQSIFRFEKGENEKLGTNIKVDFSEAKIDFSNI